MDPSWSIVTVTYNSASDIESAWDRVLELGEAEWIVVDNASTDASADIAERLGASRVVRLTKNVGFGAACNIGAQFARGRFLLFANPDLQVQASGLDILAADLDSLGGIVAPQLVHPDGSLQPNGRAEPSLPLKIANRLSRGARTKFHLFARPDTCRRVCWAIGAALAMERSEFHRLGGWDEDFFVYYEDADICLREWRSGGTVRVNGCVRWTHRWARETTGVNWKAWRNEVNGLRTFYNKYPGFLLGPRYSHAYFHDRVLRGRSNAASR